MSWLHDIIFEQYRDSLIYSFTTTKESLLTKWCSYTANINTKARSQIRITLHHLSVHMNWYDIGHAQTGECDLALQLHTCCLSADHWHAPFLQLFGILTQRKRNRPSTCSLLPFPIKTAYKIFSICCLCLQKVSLGFVSSEKNYCRIPES